MDVSDSSLQVLVLEVWILLQQVLFDFGSLLVLGGLQENHLIWNDTELANHKRLILCSWEALNNPVFTLFFEVSDLLLDNLEYDIIVNCKNNACKKFEKVCTYQKLWL